MKCYVKVARIKQTDDSFLIVGSVHSSTDLAREAYSTISTDWEIGDITELDIPEAAFPSGREPVLVKGEIADV